MKATDVQRNLCLYRNMRKRTEAISTELRGVAMLPSGGRGPYAPDITAADAARFALAVAGAERVSDASSAANDLANIVDKNGESLLNRISQTIDGTIPSFRIRAIRLYASMPMAEVLNRDGSMELFFTSAKWAEDRFQPYAQLAGYAGPIGHIGGGVLDQLAAEFAEGEETGEYVGE